LQGEIEKERRKGDVTAVAQIQDQLGREVRRLHADWEEKKAAIHAEKP
jgi:phage host-nuclease inhibitor protein Gam